MKSQTRAMIVFLTVFILFSTVLMGPFSYFADLVKKLSGTIVGLLPLSSSWQAALQLVFMALILTSLLLFGRNRQSHYIAAICALVEMVHHLTVCVVTKSLYPVSLPIAIGLALALLFLLLPSRRPALYLSDAYILAIPTIMIYEGVLGPVYDLLRLPPRIFSPLFIVTDRQWTSRLDGLLGLPELAYALVILLLAVLPVFFWARGRQKG